MARNRGGKKKQACTGKWWCGCPKCEAKPSFGSGEVGGDHKYAPPVHATTEDGNEVTASFGHNGGPGEGETLLADGHAEEMDDFYGVRGNKQHDHYNGRGGATDRGKYTGPGS